MYYEKKLKEEEFYNYWLQKYHNTTIEEIIKNELELCQTSLWYNKYAVTQEQHDEWYEWAIKRIMKYYKISKKRAVRDFSFTYLNVAPSIKNN